MLSSQGAPLDANPGDKIGWSEFWMIHTSRVMLCVIVAYLMPGMANPGSEDSWGKLMALVLTIFLHVSSEYYIVHRHHKEAATNTLSYYCSVSLCFQENEINEPLFIAFATLTTLCFVILILLLGCANIAGRGIERIVAQKIPLLLKNPRDFYSQLSQSASEAHHHHHRHYHHYHHSCCRTVVKAVLRAQKSEKELVHDHSCWQTVKNSLQRVDMEDEDDQQTCWPIAEDDKHSCWRTVDDALLGAEKVEEEHYHRHCQYCWRKVEDAVLRSWIVARAYSLEFIIARSALVSSAAAIVTIQIVITIVGGVNITPTLHLKTVYDKLRFSATVLQCAFIFIGWSMIEWRWFTAVAYYRRWQSDTWRSDFRLEDFWTRHLRELQQAREPRLRQAQLLDNKIKRTVAKEQTTFTIPRQLLNVVIALQWVTVAFSKACWLASLMFFHNKLMGKLMSLIQSKHDMHALEDYKKYEEMLKDVQMLRRSPQSLWVANRKSITKAKNLILQGNEDGEHMCEDLVGFLANKRARHKPHTGLNFLSVKRPIERTRLAQDGSDVEKQPPQQEENGSLAVEEHFTDVGAKSRKMTAVSLLSVIIHLAPIYAELDKEHCSASHEFPPKAVKDCLEAYSQAWEIVDFVEETDTESNSNISQAADRYLDILQRKVKNMYFLASKFRHATPQCLRAALDDLKKECQRKTEPPGGVNMISAVVYAFWDKEKKEKVGGQTSRWSAVGGNDSIDWKEASYGYAVYKLCNSIQCNDGTDVRKVLKELETSLADIINECLEKIQYLLLLNSTNWARNSDEKRIGKALYTAGKARAIMDRLDMKTRAMVEKENDLAIVPI